MRSPRVALLVLLLVGALAPVAPASADVDMARLRRAVQEGRIVPLEQILADAQRRVAGRVVDIDLDIDDDEYEYEIEILDGDGIVWELEYDARSGALRKIGKDD